MIWERPALALLIPSPNPSRSFRRPEGPRLFHKSGCKQVISAAQGSPWAQLGAQPLPISAARKCSVSSRRRETGPA